MSGFGFDTLLPFDQELGYPSRSLFDDDANVGPLEVSTNATSGPQSAEERRKLFCEWMHDF